MQVGVRSPGGARRARSSSEVRLSRARGAKAPRTHATGGAPGRAAQHQNAAFGRPKISGGDIDEATPDPISNSEVKLVGADGTAGGTLWESRTLPGYFTNPDSGNGVGVFLFVGRTRRSRVRRELAGPRGIRGCAHSTSAGRGCVAADGVRRGVALALRWRCAEAPAPASVPWHSEGIVVRAEDAELVGGVLRQRSRPRRCGAGRVCARALGREAGCAREDQRLGSAGS